MNVIVESIRILKGIIWQLYRQPLDMVMLLMLFCVLLWGMLGIIFQRYRVWRWLNALIFICSILLVLDITILSRSETEGMVILIPFHSFIEAQTQPEMYRSMLMNVFLFLPIGMSMPYVTSTNRLNKIFLTVMFGLLLSITIEAVQYSFHLGRCEIDDVIMNTLGTVIGSISCGVLVFHCRL